MGTNNLSIDRSNGKHVLVRRQRTAAPGDSATIGAKELQEEICKIWQSVYVLQNGPKDRVVNIAGVANWLIQAQKSLNNQHTRTADVMYCLMRARYSLEKAKEAANGGARWAYVAMGVQMLYLILVPIVLWLFSQLYSMSIHDVMDDTWYHVPVYVFIWGLHGGIPWCLYNAAYWLKRNLFDKRYLAWYIAHPWISAVLGGAISLLVIGGLTSFGADSQSEARSALLSLSSFIAGFSTNLIWQLLDRRIRKLLGGDEKKSEKAILEALM